MTITPTAPLPVTPAGAADSGGSADATPPGDFLALVQKALGAAQHGDAGKSADAADSGGGPTSGAPGGDKPADGPVTADATLAAANGLVVLVPAIAPVIPAPPGTPGSPTADLGVGAAEATTAVVPQSTNQATIQAPTLAPTQEAGPAHPATTPPSAKSPTDASTPGEAAASAPSDAAAEALGSLTTADTGSSSSGSADPGAGQPTPTVPTLLTPVAATAATTAPSAPATPAGGAPQVTGQVFPEVTSLVSRGDGTHRITLTLKPEALGEVRVVMTVRDGAVHVRLAGGHEAHQALLAGSPELSRLLEQAGATETRIVVRDLSGAVAPTTGGASTDQGSDLGPGVGAGNNRSQDQHAGTRAEQQATEGSHHTTTIGAASPRTVEPATRTRTSGVDVTM